MSRRRNFRFHAWAIHDGRGLLTRRFFGLAAPAYMRGCPVALFATRGEARGAARSKVKRKVFKRAAVRPVRVTVSVLHPSKRRAR